MPLCRVYGCDVNVGKSVHGHRFPHKRDLALAQRWLILCRIQFKSLKKFNFNGLYVCGKHFRPEDYREQQTAGARPKLKAGVVPSLHMPPSHSLPTETSSMSSRRQRRERREAAAAPAHGHASTGGSAPKTRRRKRKAKQLQVSQNKNYRYYSRGLVINKLLKLIIKL